ncbi:MAG TPA: hypothetical protein VLW52_03965 [Opitutaceae bacterium]|nr:hypothetical protein [Opitutaceae bacterium]
MLLSGLVMLAGCTATGYKMAPKTTPPPALLNLPSTEPPIEALLHTVIIYRGPGSWKRDAFWDEYIVTVANRGNALVTFESASLTDFQNQVATTGKNPWELEQTSRSLAEKGFGLAKGAAVQIGGGITVAAVGGGVGAMALSGSMFSAAGVAVGGALLLPAFVGGTIYTNVNSRHAIEREFERRRLVLPRVLVPGQLVQGSLFFRISPGPKRLTLNCRVDDVPREVEIDLTPIAGLHLKMPSPVSALTIERR